MNPDFRRILEMGSERVVADLAVKAVEDMPGSFGDLLELCFLEEYPISMRAARVIQLYCEKYPEAIYPFLDDTIEKTIRSQIGGVRRNFLKIYSEFIDLEMLREPGPLLNTCFEWLSDAGLPPAIRVHAMGVIYKMGLKEPGLHHELEVILGIMMEEAEPSLKSCGGKMLKKMTNYQ